MWNKIIESFREEDLINNRYCDDGGRGKQSFSLELGWAGFLLIQFHVCLLFLFQFPSLLPCNITFPELTCCAYRERNLLLVPYWADPDLDLIQWPPFLLASKVWDLKSFFIF